MRAPFQILVVPYRQTPNGIELLALRRADSGDWQFVAGGGEESETPLQAAQRELFEETRIRTPVAKLDTINSVPTVAVCGSLQWGTEHLVLREWAFAVNATGASIALSREHVESIWANPDDISELLRWDSNVTAAWETRERLERGLL